MCFFSMNSWWKFGFLNETISILLKGRVTWNDEQMLPWHWGDRRYTIGHCLMTTYPYFLRSMESSVFKGSVSMGLSLFIQIVELLKSAWRIIIFFVKWKLWFSYYIRLLLWQHNSYKKETNSILSYHKIFNLILQNPHSYNGQQQLKW